MAADIDREVSSILKQCYDVAIETLNKHLGKLHGLAALLIEKETVGRAEFLAFVNDETPALAEAVPSLG